MGPLSNGGGLVMDAGGQGHFAVDSNVPQQDPLGAGSYNGVSSGFKEALRSPPATLATVENVIDEPEPAPEDEQKDAVVYDMKRERLKSWAAIVFVVACWGCMFAVLKSMEAGWIQPYVCPPKEYWITAPEGSPRSCERCAQKLIFLPLFGEWERGEWPNAVRLILYFVGLLWTFLGIGIVCDQFMAAIEEITAAERVVWLEVRSGSRHKFHVKVWNATVANLTLMALGSSAPEILLAVIEIFQGSFFAGALGPSTIVGSAAFNLLMITSVCISAIPAPEIRTIAQTDVFMTTAFFSIFAYIWMLFVLTVYSPDKVDVEEGIITFMMFPVLVCLAFAADRGKFQKCRGRRRRASLSSHGRSQTFVDQETAKLQAKFGKELPAEAIALMLQKADDRPKASSKAEIRKHVMRNVTGGKVRTTANSDDGSLVVGFEERENIVLECAGTLNLKVVVNRIPGVTLQMKYQTREGTAKEGLRYRHSEGLVRFQANQMETFISVPIIDDDTWQPDEHFHCVLSELQVIGQASPGRGSGFHLTQEPRIGIDATTVTVLNDDMPGTLSFDVEEVFAREGIPVTLGIVRTHGHCGAIRCKYSTQEGSAVKDRDYRGVEGWLEFKDGETHKTIEVPIFKSSDRNTEIQEAFKVRLHDASPGVKFDKNNDGGEMCALCEVVIPPNRKVSQPMRCLLAWTNRDKIAEHLGNWQDQVSGAFYCNGTPEEQSTAGVQDWFFHCLSLAFKMLFCVIPPPSICGGWVCFCVSLGMIGFVTACIGDLATLLGCCIGIPDDITAITLVALGTSLPDTFASKLAAQQDPTADNSVGNVTGSNSVNVFLGLGMPWTIAAVNWNMQGVTKEWKDHRYQNERYEDLFLSRYPAGGFMVPAGSLSLSVGVFSCCALSCLALLAYRRYRYGGELGGPKSAQRRDSCILTFLWFIYIGASCVVSLSQDS